MQASQLPIPDSAAIDRDMPWSDTSPTTSSMNLLSFSGESASIASSPSSLTSSPARALSSRGGGLSIQFDAVGGDDHSEEGAETTPDACGESPDLEPEISSPRQPQRSTLRAAFQLRKRATNNTPGSNNSGGGGGGDAAANTGSDDDNQPLSARRQRGSAGVTATLRSARDSEAPIDEDYVFKLLATPDLLNPAKMTADENRLFERLVVQLQLQLQLKGLPTASTPTTPRAASVEQAAQH